MGKKGIVVATTVVAVMTVIFGVIGAVFLGLRRYEDDRGDRSVCKYARSPATACGVVAAVLALTTQILASVAIGCCGAWQNPKRANRVAAVVFYVISWILAIIAVLVFLGGALLGIEGYKEKTIGKTIENGSCVGGVGGEGVFVDAIFLFLVVVALEVSSYLLIQKDDHHQAAASDNPPSIPTATSPLATTATSKDDAYASAPAPANQV
ncbi:hypothetical protein CFC21_069542 [Triticum aestivum]|uniref:Uncharacterized protein n=2 Tax=Triticum aestivum TaxID=4565 RepID=A0A9R1KQV3_WHEAT|nr:uncharacterized protein LOC123110106 [Triticum aestivum]XP_044386485.1 uncharacterized protein LOC123110106 [Triticum aestivum]KAF7063007.1 hypothetical protein CFC21_069542 [Triticum aestivum]